ncbi:DNA polymerase domain-containing protein [Persephonella sp.]
MGLEGMIELSRISSIPLQQLSRTTIGTPITSMEIRLAFQKGYLIPYRKNQPEDPKSALQLIQVDRGGLSFRPPVGIYENVAEIDFFSMYPSIIAKYNLSYETINCSHTDCKTKLPTGYRVCTEKEGIVPQTLKFLLGRRLHYKKLITSQPWKADTYDKRQKGLKWLLVVSFGYLGYKNAVFGRIESHETTTAIGRQLLLFVKELAEAKGFRLLHALTDSVWIYRENASEKDYREFTEYLNKRLSERFRGLFNRDIPFEVKLEGVYDWIVFLPSKQDGTGVPNRFFGRFKDGSMKVRGIELRRSDTPEFVRGFQENAISILRRAKNKRELKKALPEVERLHKEYTEMLISGRFSPFELSVRKRVSKEITEYRMKTDVAEAAGTLVKEGITVNPGEKLRIIYIKDSLIKAVPLELYIKNPKPLDMERYTKILDEGLRIFTVLKRL